MVLFKSQLLIIFYIINTVDLFSILIKGSWIYICIQIAVLSKSKLFKKF